MVEKEDSGYTWYLQGISGDDIAYVTQACNNRESVSISHESCEIKAAISRENYHHTKNVLYLDFCEKLFNEHFSASENKNKWKVSVKFLLKKSYFFNLQGIIRSLSSEVTQRLTPNPQHFLPFHLDLLDACYEDLNLKTCSDDQRYALGTIISSPPTGPPVLVTGPFGTGKTHILALTALYYLQHSIAEKQRTCILACTQQHISADAFIECIRSLPTPKEACVVRITDRNKGYGKYNYNKSQNEFAKYCEDSPPSSSHPYLVVATCLTARKLSTIMPKGFFTHILLDEGAQMREPEAVAPLCFANMKTKVVIAGDKQQVCGVNLILYCLVDCILCM